MRKRRVLGHTAALTVALWALSPGHLEAKGSSGKAIVPAEQASRQEIFNACQDMVIDARYTIESIDVEAGLISAKSTSRALGSNKSYTYTWNIIVRSDAEKQATEIRMTRGTQQTFVPKDVDKLFVYLFETMKLDLSEILVTIGDETKPALDWKDTKKKKKKKKKKGDG